MRRSILGALMLLFGNIIIAATPVTPASAEVTAASREALRTAFASPDALRNAVLCADTLSIGPRLWAATVEARKQFAADTKETYAIVPSPQIVEKWKLSALDLSTISDPTLRSLLVEGSKAGTPVLAGAIMKRANAILPALLLTLAKASEFPFSVRVPTESEIQYYYAVIPYDLSDPILVVESAGHTFLCDFEDGNKVFYIEML
jgi:hypothetical protein